MIRINILCEGPTEELFVERVLYPHFILRGIIVTRRPLDGGFNYDRLKYNIVQWLNQEQGAYVTTLIDLYGVNNDYPGYAENQKLAAFEKVAAVERLLAENILATPRLHNKKFIPHFQLHEFEALLFSNPKIMQEWFSLDHDLPNNCFTMIRSTFETPEHINDSRHTAPSKRIEKFVSSYKKKKTTEGVLIAEDIGLGQLRQECPHFNAWLTQLEKLE